MTLCVCIGLCIADEDDVKCIARTDTVIPEKRVRRDVTARLRDLFDESQSMLIGTVLLYARECCDLGRRRKGGMDVADESRYEDDPGTRVALPIARRPEHEFTRLPPAAESITAGREMVGMIDQGIGQGRRARVGWMNGKVKGELRDEERF
jgi:hypothetical protein